LQLMCAFAEILGSMGCSPICLPSWIFHNANC
jgi:hypothetical protein